MKRKEFLEHLHKTRIVFLTMVEELSAEEREQVRIKIAKLEELHEAQGGDNNLTAAYAASIASLNLFLRSNPD